MNTNHPTTDCIGRLPQKGWGPFKSHWYSMCSAHRGFKSGCGCCECGHWVNANQQIISSFFHKHAYPIWYWWANSSFGSFRRFIKTDKMRKNFPNLK